MKRAGAVVFLFLLLLAGVAWWAVRSVQSAEQPACEEEDTAPVAYPPDMWEELSRLSAIRVVYADAGELSPADLSWSSGDGEEPIGSSQARRGGVLRLSSPGPFPSNLLAFGSPTPQFFHANAFTRVEMPLVAQHPVTHRPIPGVACEWAVRGRTVFFRLHPAARYTNGRPVRAADYALGALLRAKSRDAAWEALSASAEELRVYDDRTLSLTLRHGDVLAVLRASALLHAAEPGFYADFTGDYAERYAWRTPPSTGAYSVARVEQGRLIELRRVRHWWAQDLPLYRHTANVDAIQFHFLTDEAQAFELLLRGQLDMVQTRHVASCQRYADARGIVRTELSATCPPPPYGIALNARRLSLPLRRGLMHAMDMDRAMAVIFRGEGERLRAFFSGYGALSPKDAPRVAYAPVQARAAFAQAGFCTAGEDGILRRADGTRLSVRLSYVPSEKVSTLVEILRESARTCGAEILPEPLSWQACAQQVRDGSHDLTFWATVPAQPLPAPERYFHSSASGDEAPFGLREASMDEALAACAAAHDEAQFADALSHVERLVRELAVWLPGWRESHAHVLHLPRVQFPSEPGFYVDAVDNHTLWIESRDKKGGEP